MRTSKDLAVFLLSNLTLIDKDALGQFIGDYQELNQKVLKDFTQLINFRRLGIDDALRLYLGHFSLPGEAQQIERIVTAFSEQYCKQNPETLCEDSVYLLTYSLIMLQTDAHNSNVANKMDLKTFLGITRHIKANKTESLAENYLVSLFESVTNCPLAVHHKAKKESDR